MRLLSRLRLTFSTRIRFSTLRLIPYTCTGKLIYLLKKAHKRTLNQKNQLKLVPGRDPVPRKATLYLRARSVCTGIQVCQQTTTAFAYPQRCIMAERALLCSSCKSDITERNENPYARSLVGCAEDVRTLQQNYY